MQFYKPPVRGFGSRTWDTGTLCGHYHSVSSFELEAIANGLTDSGHVNQSQLRQQLNQSKQVIKLRIENRINKHNIMSKPTGMEQ
jgi:hypothetical protein